MKKLILGVVFGFLLGYSVMVGAGLVNKPFTFSSGQPARSAEVNANWDVLYNEFNGNITNVNISPSAAIDGNKLFITGFINMSHFTGSLVTPTSSQLVGSARQIICGNGLLGCGQMNVDRTMSVAPDTTVQRVNVQNNGVFQGSRSSHNFQPGPLGEIVWGMSEDGANNRVNIQPAIAVGSLSNNLIKTAVGSFGSGGAAANLTMNDYSFFPNITTDESNDLAMTRFNNQADPGDTVARLRVPAQTVVRWRYITASRPAELLVARVGDEIQAYWMSEIDNPNVSPLEVEGAETVQVLEFPESWGSLAVNLVGLIEQSGLNCGGSIQGELKARANSRGVALLKDATLCKVVE